MTDDEMAGAAEDYLLESLASFEERASAVERMAASLRRDISILRRMNTTPLSEPPQETGPNYMGRD